MLDQCLKQGIIEPAVTGEQNLFGHLGNMTMVNVLGDGNCFFRVIAHHISRLRSFWALNNWTESTNMQMPPSLLSTCYLFRRSWCLEFQSRQEKFQPVFAH
jgi:hypothetical protein